MIVYSDAIGQLNHIPYHITANNKTVLFQRHIADFICGGKEKYDKFYSSLNTYQLENEEVVDFVQFMDYSIDLHFDAFEKAKSDEDYKQLYQLLRPMVLTLAKIGAKHISNDYAKNETPSMILERELLVVRR